MRLQRHRSNVSACAAILPSRNVNRESMTLWTGRPVTEMGGIVFPPLPAFYHRPQSIDEMVADTVERVLQTLRIAGATPLRWDGLRAS